MRAQDFRVWQARSGKSGRQIAKDLGKSEDTVSKYRMDGVPERDSITIRLALSAIEAGLSPWSDKPSK